MVTNGTIMATKSLTAFVVVVAILVAIFPQYFKIIFIQFGGLVPPLFYHSASSKMFNFLSYSTDKKGKLFTIEELSSFNGHKGSAGLYLSILGKVYDVQKGRKHYGPGGSYRGFAGRDSSAAFATGDFTDTGLAQNVLTLSDAEVKAVWDWVDFYDRDYKYKGKLIGQFYDDSGEPTLDYQSVVEMVKRAEKHNESKKAEMRKFPPCNMEWSAETGSRVWCSLRSGGIERDWVGVPRKYYEPGAESYRCACIPLSVISQSTSQGMIEEYELCRPQAESCFIKTNK